MKTPQPWRQHLQRLIADPREKQRVAQEAGISVMTLWRWANGDSEPRKENLQALLAAFPSSPSFQQALRAAYPALAGEGDDLSAAAAQEAETVTDPRPIPHVFYETILSDVARLDPKMRFWSVARLVLQQLLGHLDTSHAGMVVVVAQCLPPTGRYIRSLRTIIGLSSLPSYSHQEMLLGAESLAGKALAQMRVVDLHGSHEQGIDDLDPEARSAVASPILHESRIAGSLLLSSRHPLLPAQYALVQHYTDLMALAFAHEQFYASESIQLQVLPARAQQRTVLSQFQKRVTTLMVEGAATQHFVAPEDAELRVWQHMESDLFDVAAAQ